MKVTQILKKLESIQYDFRYIGSKAAEIYVITPLVDIHTIRPEILYLSDAAEMAETGHFRGNFLLLKDPTLMGHLLPLLQRWLIDDSKRREWLTRLSQSMAWGCGIYELSMYCSRVLENPVLFFNHKLELLCQYPKTELSEARLDSIVSQVDAYQLNGSDLSTEFTASDCVIRQLFFQEEDYYLCLLPEDRPFDPVFDPDYLQQICHAFDSKTYQGWKETQLGVFITGLLQRRFSYTEKEREYLTSLNWEFHEKYYVLTVERIQPSANDDLRQELESLLKLPLYPLGKYWVSILHSAKHVEYTEQDFRKESKLLKERGCLALLSMGFFDLADCATSFEQCRICIEISHEHRHLGILSCSRHQIGYMMRVLNRNNRVDLRRFCSPVILLLYDFDKQQGTNYLGTLFTYICSGLSMKHSAAVLNIHVNTMYLRINWLRDEFNIDFNDAHMLYTLRNSIVLLNLCDKNSLAPGTGWPFLSD